MKNSSKTILEAWLDYIKCSAEEKSKISASKVHEDHHILFSKDDCNEDANGVVFHISSEVYESWKKHFVKYDKQGNITYVKPVNLLFPLLSCIEYERGKSNVKYLPLFSFPLPESFFKQDSNSLLIPVKDGQQITALPFAFREMFGIQLAELGENRHMMSIVSALTGCKYDSFMEAFEALQVWVTQQSNGKYKLENAFNALVAPLHNEDYNLKRDGEDFSWLCKNDRAEFPLLEQYLNHIHSEDHTSNRYELVTGGLFETHYPLGHGQMEAIQAINQDVRLIAVQGAPGTGKTTLFKSIIAQQLVARALAIADGKDGNFGMLVVSTAIKAVENIIDDLRSDPLTQQLDWLWFHGGSNDQVKKELDRLESLIDCWRKEIYDEEIQRDSLAILLKNRSELDLCHKQYLNHKANVLQSVIDCELNTSEVEKLPLRFTEKLAEFAGYAQQQGVSVSIDHPDDLNDFADQLTQSLQLLRQEKARYQQAEKVYQTQQAIWALPHNAEQILRWIDSPLRPALEIHYRDYPRRGIKLYLARLFGGKYRERLQRMHTAAPEDFQYFNLAAYSHKQLTALADTGQRLSQQPEILKLMNFFLQYKPDPKQEERLLALNTRTSKLQAQWNKVVRAQKAMVQYQEHYPEGSWCDILRKRFISQHREMFEAAIGYLWQEQLKRKDELEEVLTHWQALMSGRQSAGYYRWLDKMDEFYSSLSLVYPVMATTLVSAWKMAGYRKLDELKGHKPWNLALCDEAGMISIESLVPLLSRSEKAMIVGDPLQIEPIRNLSENLQTQLRERHFKDDNILYERVSPASVTAWHRAAGSLSGRVDDIGNGIVLDEHRRCQKPIADLFIRLAGYRGVTVKTAEPSERITSAFEKSGGHHLMFYSVEGRKGDVVNTNIDEVDAIEQLLDKLEEGGYDLTTDVGIITPYANQKILLINRLAQRMNHKQKTCIGTVHQFQGVGFEIIIYSPVIFHPLDTVSFQNNIPNMLNVVVSRAKQQFIVVGNYHRLRQAGGYLKVLADSVAEDFILEQGSQHPQFPNLSKTPRLQRYYRNCEHIAAFNALAAKSEVELIVITPWIRRGGKEYQRPELAQLVTAQQRGVRVKVYYGYFHQRFERADDNDESLITEYCEKLGKENVVRLVEGTHEKVLMIDSRYIILGSWNWLSHGYHNSCQRSDKFSNAIRHEISAELDDSSMVSELRERLGLE